MRMSAPAALASSRLPSDPGTRIMSPKQVKITPSLWAIAIPSSTRPIGITHTGQPGPCTSSTLAGQQVVDPVLVDRVRVAAAHLHQLVVAAGLDQRQDLRRPRRGRARRRGTRRRTSRGGLQMASSAVPACTSSDRPARPARPARSRPSSRLPSCVGAQREPAVRVDSHDGHRHAVVAAGDAVVRAAGVGRRRLTRSRWPSAPRAPARSRRPSARAGRAWPAPPPRRPGRSRSRRGSGPSRPARRPPSSPSSRPTLTLRRTPATSTLASRFGRRRSRRSGQGSPGTRPRVLPPDRQRL